MFCILAQFSLSNLTHVMPGLMHIHLIIEECDKTTWFTLSKHCLVTADITQLCTIMPTNLTGQYFHNFHEFKDIHENSQSSALDLLCLQDASARG